MNRAIFQARGAEMSNARTPSFFHLARVPEGLLSCRSPAALRPLSRRKMNLLHEDDPSFFDAGMLTFKWQISSGTSPQENVLKKYQIIDDGGAYPCRIGRENADDGSRTVVGGWSASQLALLLALM